MSPGLEDGSYFAEIRGLMKSVASVQVQKDWKQKVSLQELLIITQCNKNT